MDFNKSRANIAIALIMMSCVAQQPVHKSYSWKLRVVEPNGETTSDTWITHINTDLKDNVVLQIPLPRSSEKCFILNGEKNNQKLINCSKLTTVFICKKDADLLHFSVHDVNSPLYLVNLQCNIEK
jgi:hypothetical protein